jgi:cysteine desulfurase
MSAEIYLDCNATNPIEPRVLEAMAPFWETEIGNAASHHHGYGARARAAVEQARAQIAKMLDCEACDLVFTSGATEANNLAILGLAPALEADDRRHIITSAIEHPAVLEPIRFLQSRGFEVDLLSPNPLGWVEPEDLARALRPDTGLVSLMHVNNETGVVQPIDAYARVLDDHQAYFHVDAAQGFGRDLKGLSNPRIDLTSLSAHKIYGPRGIGAILTRPRGYAYPPLSPLVHGGGHERGLRPGTLPVPLIVGFGEAAQLARKHHASRLRAIKAMRKQALKAFEPVEPVIHGDPQRTLPHVLNVSFPGVTAQALFLILKGLVAISHGSACVTGSQRDSHVLTAMGVDPVRRGEAVRMSWSHLTPTPSWEAIAARIRSMR